MSSLRIYQNNIFGLFFFGTEVCLQVEDFAVFGMKLCLQVEDFALYPAFGSEIWKREYFQRKIGTNIHEENFVDFVVTTWLSL